MMNHEDEQLALLREIRDTLREQTELVKAQWVKYDAINRRNQIIWLFVLFPLMFSACAWFVLK